MKRQEAATISAGTVAVKLQTQVCQGRLESMKRLAPILILAGMIPGVAPAVEWGLPWFHTRPKPVLLDDQGAQPVSQKMVKRSEYKRSDQDEMSRPVWADSHRSREIVRGEPSSHPGNGSGKKSGKQTNHNR